MKSSKNERELDVYLDSEIVDSPTLIGRLFSEQNNVRFEYAASWLEHKQAFSLDRRLDLGKGVFHAEPKQSNFGVFLDSSPDRWGQKLMDRREQMEAHDQKRVPRVLYAWDYLIGVQDETRMGALRFKIPGADAFLDNHPLPAPPVTELANLELVASHISSNKALEDLTKLRRWLAVLVAPGASLGGAHPKANYLDKDGSLWIAKFPSRDDDRDNGAWEKLVHDMASEVGFSVPPARLVQLTRPFRTFAVRRFDRTGKQRHFFRSAMTALGRSDGESGSYLDLLDFIQRNGASKDAIAKDQLELFKRVTFNVAVGNRDDHLRNHGFLWANGGWRLAPAFDMNPSHEKQVHVLTIDGRSSAPSLDTVLDVAGYYGLKRDAAAAVIANIVSIASTWRARAEALHLPRGDIELTAPAFSALSQ